MSGLPNTLYRSLLSAATPEELLFHCRIPCFDGIFQWARFNRAFGGLSSSVVGRLVFYLWPSREYEEQTTTLLGRCALVSDRQSTSTKDSHLNSAASREHEESLANLPVKIDGMTRHDLDITDGLDFDISHLPSECYDDSSSVYSQEMPDMDEPERTLHLFDTNSLACTGGSRFAEGLIDASPSWFPASPVPSHINLTSMEHFRPLQSDLALSKSARPGSSGLHHFETIPARRSNHNEHSAVGARDLYHATATQIAKSSDSAKPRSSPRPGTAHDDRQCMVHFHDSPRQVRQSEDTDKRQSSFAEKVLRTSRRKPPAIIETGKFPHNSAKHHPRSPYPTSDAAIGPPRQGVESNAVRSSDGRSRYSAALSRAFRRGSGSDSENSWRKSVDSEYSEPEGRFVILTHSRRASGPDTPMPPVLTTGEQATAPQRAGQHWSEWTARAKKTASTVVKSREERRRDA